MALEAALVGAKRFRFLAQSTVLSTGFTSAGLLWASQQPGFSVEIIWRSVGGLFLLRSFTAAVELGRALSFYGKPPAATAA
jgi:dienelactone hydrolase